MASAAPVRRLGQSLGATPAIGIALALLLLVASLVLALHAERVSRNEKVAEVQVQARILAGSLAGPLAFDDDAAAREYIQALAANPDVRAAGAYAADGRLVAGFARFGAVLPRENRVGPPLVEDDGLVVTAPVAERGTRLGSVHLRTAREAWPRRLARYVGVAIVLVMAALLIAALAIFYASTAAANRRLQAEIAGREEAERALAQAQKMEAMGQLTGGVAHDFNNLLMVASSGLELMERTQDPARRDRLRDGIRQAIERGAKLTQQLLTFARRSPLSPEVVDLAARVRGMRDLLDRSLREDISIRLELPDDLWPVEVDPSQFDVAVLNVTINARDAMPHGGTIVIDAANEGEVVRLSIRDTGGGIPPELMDKVFEPFFTTKGVGSGTGLGLSQVYGFARSSGGDVRIESLVGQGTVVTLRFPRSAKPLPRPPGGDAPAAAERGDARVLLVEDDDHVAELVGDMLGELGYVHVRRPGAAEALTALEADGPFDLVLSDMIMPGEMNGLDLARATARARPGLPVVLMTGYSDAAAAAQLEGLPLLVKPYTIDLLAGVLAKAVRRA